MSVMSFSDQLSFGPTSDYCPDKDNTQSNDGCESDSTMFTPSQGNSRFSNFKMGTQKKSSRQKKFVSRKKKFVKTKS